MSYTGSIFTPAKLTGGIINHTGSTSETKIWSTPIPANTLSVNDILDFLSFCGGDGSGNKTLRLYTNTTDDLTGTPVFLGFYTFTTSATNTAFSRCLFSANSLTSWYGINNSTSANSTFVSNSTTPSNYTINFGIDQYLIISAQLATSSNTINLYGVRSTIYR